MITNLIFDLSGYGGSANFTAATEAILINELNTLTGVTWYWDPADCKPKSNFYPGVPPVITTAYKVSFVDIDGDSTGFCNAGSLDFTKFNEIDLTAYGGSATTAIANNTDIVNAFAALSLTVSVSGCDLIIDNWNHVSTPTNVEVNLAVAGCVATNIENGGFILSLNGGGGSTFSWNILDGINVDGAGITVDWGDGNTNTYTSLPAAPSHSYFNGFYNILISYTTTNGDFISYTFFITVVTGGWTTNDGTNYSPGSFVVDPITLDSTDCANVLMTTNVNIETWPQFPNAVDLDVTVNGNTSTFSVTCGSYPCSIPINNMNIGAITVPGSYPALFEFKDNGIVTSTFTTTINLS